MNKESLKQAAFTLAETLITITIIGIVMALMLRSISRVNPDKYKILFLKSYHSIETAVANIITDASKYDQNTEENGDFSSIPLSTAYAKINDTIYCTNGWEDSEDSDIKCTQKVINQSNALCYFLAEQINFVGNFNCNGGADTVNFVTTNGVCFKGWTGFGTDSITGKVVTQCPNGDPKNDGYEIKVYKEGKMTVPTGSDGTLQGDAYRWINDQTQIKN